MVGFLTPQLIRFGTRQALKRVAKEAGQRALRRELRARGLELTDIPGVTGDPLIPPGSIDDLGDIF